MPITRTPTALVKKKLLEENIIRLNSIKDSKKLYIMGPYCLVINSCVCSGFQETTMKSILRLKIDKPMIPRTATRRSMSNSVDKES